MRISDTEVKKVLSQPKIVAEIVEMEDARQREADSQMAQELTARLTTLGDREDRIQELRAQIASGDYHPSAEEIVDRMARRAIADQIR